MNTINIPTPDPMPLPAPLWLLKSLLLLLFFLHLLAMNCAAGGGLTVLLNAVRGFSDRHRFSRRLARELAPMLPVFVAFTVTLGVAALLFLQVIYGNLFYTSSILIGTAWLSVVVLVIVGYYGYYYFSFRTESSPKVAAAVLAIGVLCFLSVALALVSNMSLMLTPDRWLQMYRAHSGGMQLNFGEPTFLARYLHMLIGAVTVFTAVLAHLAIRKMKTDLEYGSWLLRRAAIVFALTIGIQFITGMWFVMQMPRQIALSLFREPVPGIVFGVSVLLSLLAMVLLLIGSTAGRPGPAVHAGFGCAVLTLALMVGLRHMVRTAYLAPHFDPAGLPVSSQSGVIAIFLVTFVVGLATVGYMISRLARTSREAARATAAH